MEKPKAGPSLTLGAPAENESLAQGTFDGDELVSAPEFGRLVAVAVFGPEPAPKPFSETAITRWVRRGLVKPARVETRDDGSVLKRYFRAADAQGLRGRVQRADIGGRRPNSGRKPADPGPRDQRPTEGELAQRMAVAELAADVAGRSSPPDQPLPHTDLPRLSTAELRLLAQYADPDGPMTDAALGRFKLLVDLQAKQLDNGRRAGTLIEAEAARRAWAATLSGLRGRMEGLPARLADALTPLAAPNDAETAAAMDLLLAAGCDADAARAAIDLLKRPPDLRQAYREAALAEVRGMLGELAG